MKLTGEKWMRAGRWMAVGLALLALGWLAAAQGVSTTTVQGTVYLANGQPGAGTLTVSWPAFTTSASQAVAAGSLQVAIGTGGSVSVSLAPNLGASPAGLYYTAVYNMSDGSTSTEYWIVPATSPATIAQVRAQVMPAAQATQAVSKAYVDEAIAELAGGVFSGSGGTLTGPLYLSGDPTQPLQAADKHYVDESVAGAVPLAGGNMTGPLQTPAVNGMQSPLAGSGQTTLQAAVNAAGTGGAVEIPPAYAGTDGFTNPNGVYVEDLRTGGAQQRERSVKEFGAVCDGATNDTSALQAALNYANAHGVALTIPQGTCKTHQLNWHGESIGGMSKQASALMGFPGEDVLASQADSLSLLAYTHIHDLTIYVDQSVDNSCSPAEGRAAAGVCGVNRPLESNSIFSPGGSGLTGTAGTGAGWSVGNCAIAMPASTGAGGNGLRVAEIENVEIATTGADPLAAYTGAHSTHTCGLYLAQWPQWSEFRNIDIRGVNTGIAIPALPVTTPAGLNADSNRWQNITIQATHGFTAAAGANNVLDNVVVMAGNSAATAEPPTGLVLDFAAVEQGWTVRNAVVLPAWNALKPVLTVAASGGAVTGVTVGTEHGLGWDPYGATVPLAFSGSCTAQANASVNSSGSIGTVTVTAGGVGCSGTTTASVNAAGTWDKAAPVNLITGQNMTFIGGSLEKGNGGYTVWNAASSQTVGTQLSGGGSLIAGGTYPALVVNDGLATGLGFTGSVNRFEQLGLSGGLEDNGLGNTVIEANAEGSGATGAEPARQAANTVSADFALLGGGAASGGFTSLNDLFLSAEDLLWSAGESAGTGSRFGKDAAAPVTGSYVKAMGGAWDTTGPWHVRGTANVLVLGQGFPLGMGTWYVAAKADTATTQELKLTGVNGSGTICTFADQTLSLTTSWQVFDIPYNTVTGNPTCDNSTQGNPVTAAGLTPGTSTNVETAWMAFVPAFQQIELAAAPTLASQAATKGYVDAAVTNQIANGSGYLPIAGGTMTGPLTAPVFDGTTNCATSSSLNTCMQGANAALIPPGTSGSYTQGATATATATCVYDLTQSGKVMQVNPGSLGLGYTSAPAVTVNNSGSGGTGLAVTASVTSGQVASYTVTNGGSGYTSCPSISVAAPPALATPIPVMDQRKGITSYNAVIRVDDFGCAGDGATDDTQCINNAIGFATSNGTRPGSIALTDGKTYLVTNITGYMPTAADDGSAPASGDTCARSNAAQSPPISGSTCAALAPETPGQLGFAIRVPNGLTIYGNSATIKSNFVSTATSFNLAKPDIAIFGSEKAYQSLAVYDLTLSQAFIGWAAPGVDAGWIFHNVNTNATGVSVLVNTLELSQFRDINFQSMAGVVAGGWWQCRANGKCPQATGDFASNVLIDGYQYTGLAPSTPLGGVVANQNGLDSWFNTYFFHEGDNASRMTDSQYAALGADTDSFWHGIFGVGVAYYSRTGNQSKSDVIRNYVDLSGMSYPVIVTTPDNLLVDSLSGAGVGDCASGSGWGGSACPNPYDPVNTQLVGAVLVQSPTAVVVRNVEGDGIDAEEVVGESWRNSTPQTVASLRQGVTSTNSRVDSRFAIANPQPGTDRSIHNYSNIAALNGTADSGEECFNALGSYASGSTDQDEWCLRNALSAYSGTSSAGRFFVLEDEYNGGHFTGPAAVQMPGVRVRTGAISSSDTTLAVTDFSSQAFTIAGGTVSPGSCATIAGVTLPGAATSDGVLFVEAPFNTGPLALAGNVTAANTLSVSVCNPTTAAASYPSGTYAAFLLAGAGAPSIPGASGGAPTSTSPLTTTLGDLVTANVSGAPTRLAGNTAAQLAVLTQTGTGSVSATPAWETAPQVLTSLGAANLNASTVQFTGEVTGKQVGAAYQVDQFAGADFGAKLQACLNGLSSTYGGICDARNFTGTVAMSASVSIATGNATVLLPCATISTASQVIVTAGTRNVALRGCALRGGTSSSGSAGGTAFAYTGSAALVQVGDPTYAADTQGFHLDNVVINTTGSSSAAAQGLVAYRTQELDVESVYLLGNSNQTGMTLDGTGNYTGGTFFDNAFNGFQIAVNAIGHQVSNPATTDWMNASTFVRLHIDCPTSGGSPISGTYGINLQQGDGNSFTGGDVEGCNTALHLGANAQNNTVVGLRNENSTSQVVADTGSSYNSWITGGAMLTGKLTDNGTRNSFLDTFHRSFNGLNGDWYGSQQDATVTNHYRIGIGAGNERGLLNRYQTDYGYRWTMGLSDATAGAQFYQILDELNNVYRFSITQYNNGSSSTNNQTVINAAGTGGIVLNGSNNAGTGGVVFGSGGVTETTVATVDSSGDAQFDGTLEVGGASTFTGSTTVKNAADAEIDQFLWAGATTSQKESFIYKDYNGSSQWYMVKDASSNWALNSATGGLDSFKAYQSTNSGDTYVNASNSSGVVRVNYESGSGTQFKVYGGSSSTLYASFTGTNAIQFPGLAASSGHDCLQVDNSGYITNTGAACGTGNGTGTVSSGTNGQIAYYSGSGNSLAGENTVPVSAGGTGASTAATAIANLNGISSTVTAAQTLAGSLTGPSFNNLTNFANLSGSSVAAQFNNWISSTNTSAARSVLWVDPQVAAGSPTSALGSLERIVDARGTNCMDSVGGFTGADNALCMEAAEDSADSTTTPTNKADVHLSYNSIAGGVYNFTGTSGVKSNRSVLAMTGEFSTVAQKWGINASYSSYAGGETIPFGTNQTEYGGYVSDGQETAEAVRIQQQQGSLTDGSGGVWSAVASAVNSGTGVVTFNTPTTNAATLGESRFIRDVTSKYNTGTYSAVSCSGTTPTTCTITGSGTSWTSISGFAGTHTTFNNLASGGNILTNNLVFCAAPGANGGFDACVPITSGVSATSLTVNLYAVGSQENTGWPWATSGNYAIYGSAYPTAVSVAGDTFTAGDVSGIASGHTLDQVEAYNGDFFGIYMLQSRNIGRTYGGGIDIENRGTSTGPAFAVGVTVNGNYGCAFCVQTNSENSGSPQIDLEMFARPASGLANIVDNSSASATSYNFYQTRMSDNSTGNVFAINPNMSSGSVGLDIFGTALTVGANANGVAVNGNPNSTVQFAVNVAASATDGILETEATGPLCSGCSMLDIDGLPSGGQTNYKRFADNGFGVLAEQNNNGTVTGWYSDTGSTMKAQVNGSTGAASFVSVTDTGLTSATVVGTSSAGLLQAASTSGTGAVALVNGPTFTGNATTFANNSANEDDLVIQPGTTADQVGAIEWNAYSGTDEWKLRKDASNYLRLTDVVNSLDRAVFFQNGQTVINSGAGANAVVINSSTSSGTGGLLIESGGSSPATEFAVTGSGNTTATGFLSGKFLIGSGTMSLATGAAAGTSPSIACASSHVCDGVSGTVTLTTGTSPATGTLATLSFPNTHTNQANCVVTPTLSGTGLVTTITWSESTTALTLTANTALAASTAYQVRYWCGGN